VRTTCSALELTTANQVNQSIVTQQKETSNLRRTGKFTMLRSTNRCEQRRTDQTRPWSSSRMESCDQPEEYLHCAGQGKVTDGCRSSAVKWPPPNLTGSDDLGFEQAEDLISHGAATFLGYYEHTSCDHRRYYAVVGNGLSGGTDQARSSEQATKYMSATLTCAPNPVHPWRSLEQPSLLSCFGEVPGSITLNYWLGTFGESQPAVEQSGSLWTREVELLWLMERIGRLELGLETDVRTLSLLTSNGLATISDAETSRNVFTQPYTGSSCLTVVKTHALTAQKANRLQTLLRS
jgi:hypothetical protein